MKVLHIISGLNNGGAEAVLFRLATVSQKGGDHHHVVSLMDRGIYADRLEEAGVVVSTLNMPRGRVTLGGLIYLYQLIKRVNPDVVQTWMYHADLIGGVLARLAGIKVIVWGVHHANFDPDKNSRMTLLIAKTCARLSKIVPTKIVSCSVMSSKLHQDIGYCLNKFVVIPNGYPLDKLRPDTRDRFTVRQELKIASNIFVLGMVARFDPQKDHQNLIKALGHLKQKDQKFVCLLVGFGMDENNSFLMAELSNAGVREQVKLLGLRNDIPAVMNALDVHVLASLGEAFPNVLAEAMACGTPCVSTNVGDAALIVGDFGWIVPARNPVALADGLIQARTLFENNHTKWHELQLGGRDHIIGNFELNQMCDRYRSTWQMCAHASG
jgi:glycosyltransferase involved in cell wall biosynthesis